MPTSPTRLHDPDPPSPMAVVARAPAELPLVALISADEREPGAWSLIAVPTAWREAEPGSLGSGAAAVEALRTLLIPPAGEPVAPRGDKSGLSGPTRPAGAPLAEACPFAGGWVACLAYDLGRSLEPEVDRFAGPLDQPAPGRPADPDAAAAARDDRDWPDVLLARVTGGLAYDHDHRQWWWFGAAAANVRRRLENAVAGAGRPGAAAGPPSDTPPEACPGPATAGTPPAEHRSLDDRTHEAAVRTAIAAIASGEIFQATITRRRSVRFDGALRVLAAAGIATARPRYGALLEAPGGRGIVSLSPELFLDVRRAEPAAAWTGAPASRIVRTRPIKGTAAAPGSGSGSGSTPAPGASDPAGALGAASLLASEKDAAELTMIVDLMRNDLGRVARPGGVRLTRPRYVETHPTVHHAAAEVSALLRDEVDVADLLAATFPPGSVTGAPKIRAMQVIDRLEPVRRGPYCGSIGWIGDDGSLRLNVAIRTLAVSPIAGDAPPGEPELEFPTDRRRGWLDYGTGGGIVADSDPADERREADLKAAVFLATLARLRAADEAADIDRSPPPARPLATG